MSDFTIRNEGTIFLVTPSSQEALQHLIDNTGEEAQFFGKSLVVEHRYIGDLVTGLRDNGWSVE